MSRKAAAVLHETPDLAAMALRALDDAAIDLTFAADRLTTVQDALHLHQEIERALKAIEYASGLAIDKADEILKGQAV